MTPEEHLNKIQEKLDFVATLQRSHDEQIGKLVDLGGANDRRLNILGERLDVLTEQVGVLTGRVGILTERTIQVIDTVNRLARIVEIREDRIDSLENPPQ